MARTSMRVLLGMVLGLSAIPGCFTAATPEQEASRFTREVGGLGLPDALRKEVVQAYLPHAAKATAREAELLIHEFRALGLAGPDLVSAFRVALSAHEGTGTAAGTARILRFAFPRGKAAAEPALRLLVAREAAAHGKAHEGATVKGVAVLMRIADTSVDDLVCYLEGLPAAHAAGMEAEAIVLFLDFAKLRMPRAVHARVYRLALMAGARKLDLDVFRWFLMQLRTSRVVEPVLLGYLDALARHANERVDVHGLAAAFDAVGLLPLAEEQRLELFGGVVAGIAAGATPQDVEAALGSLASAKAPPPLLKRMIGATLHAYAAYPAASVTRAVERALQTGTEGDALAEELTRQLSIAAAGGRRK